ncbi:zinc ribbon domain-containing protein [Streptosporangium soli]
MSRAALTSACSAKPHDVQTKVSWSGRFFYKAARAGIALVQVDPAYTFQQRSACGHVDITRRVPAPSGERSYASAAGRPSAGSGGSVRPGAPGSAPATRGVGGEFDSAPHHGRATPGRAWAPTGRSWQGIGAVAVEPNRRTKHHKSR